MNAGRRQDAAPSRSPDDIGRNACLDLLAIALAHRPGGARGTALFLLDCSGPRPADAVAAEVERRLRAAAPPWHRLLRGDAGEFAVMAQGLVDGGAVLAAAARLVHAFDDALQAMELAPCPDIAIGIAFASQPTAGAESMLRAAESGLCESRAATRPAATAGRPSIRSARPSRRTP